MNCRCGKSLKLVGTVYQCACGNRMSKAMVEAKLKLQASQKATAQQVVVQRKQMIAAWEETAVTYGKPVEVVPEINFQEVQETVTLDDSFTLQPCVEPVLQDTREEEEAFMPLPVSED